MNCGMFRRLSGILATLLAASLLHVASATSASAEPTGWNMECKQPLSQTRVVTNPASCAGGEIRFRNWKSGKVDAYLDVDAMESRYKRTMSYAEFERKCTSSLACSIAAGIVVTFFGKKLKMLWNALRAARG